MIKDNTQVRAYESFLKSYEDKSEVISSPVTFMGPAFYAFSPQNSGQVPVPKVEKTTSILSGHQDVTDRCLYLFHLLAALASVHDDIACISSNKQVSPYLLHNT